MAIRDWGEDEPADEPKKKKELGPAFWVALLLVLAISPWLSQIPAKIREYREEQARMIPDVCGEAEENGQGEAEPVREWPELAGPAADLAPGEVADFRAPATERRPGWPELAEFDGQTKRLKLRGFALSIPHPLDPLAPSRESVEKLVFLDPETLEPVPKLISRLETGKSRFAPGAAEVCTATRWRPGIHLAFEKLEPAARIRLDSIVDERTGADVSGAGVPLVVQTEKGLIVGSGLGIWHDTPLRITLEVAAGEFEWFRVAGLPRMPNGRDVEDLFEIRIPRARYWTQADQPDALFDVIRAATELRGGGRRWPARRPEGEGEGWSLVEIYDATARELAEKLAKTDPLAIDQARMALWRVKK